MINKIPVAASCSISSLQGNVEVWLLELLQQSQKSLHGVIRTASVVIKDPSFKLIEFMDNFPAQVGVTWISYNHVIGVCQLSQSTPEKHSQEKKCPQTFAHLALNFGHV